MTVKDLLTMHKGGVASVTIQQTLHNKQETYFEEINQDDIFSSDIFKKIENVQVDYFHVIGGGMYNVELCIYLKEEN